MATDTQKTDMVQYLNQFCFENIWSAMSEQYRVNIPLTPATTRLQTAIFTYDGAVVGLPTTGVYRVFCFNKTSLRGGWGPQDSIWYSTDQIARDTGDKFSVYDVGGRLTPMCETWLLSPKGSDMIFVALHKNAIVATIPNAITTDFYITLFKNTSEAQTGWTVFSQKIVKATDADTALGNAKRSSQSMVVVNGVSYTDMTTLPTIKVGDYVDVGIDPTIYTTYVVPVDDTDNGYSSVKYAEDREILHCPKAQNPNSWILTHDGTTLFIRDTITKKGVYFHRVDPHSVKQITHNDISASRSTIDAFKASMSATQVEIVVMVRTLDTPRTLMSESGWIADLYLSDDTDIISHLRGVLDDTLTFWKASELEQSGYVTLMFSDGDSTDASRLDDYVAALGYYATAAILSTGVYTGTYDRSDMVFTKSFVQRGQSITPLVYLNGVKVPQSVVTSIDYDCVRSGVSLSDSVTRAQGQDAYIRVMDAGVVTPLIFTPSADTPSITITPDYSTSLYRKESISAINGYERSSTTAYVYTPPGFLTYQLYTSDTGTEITFNETVYGTPFIIPVKRFMWYKSITIDDMLGSAEPLVIPVTMEDSNGNELPMLTYGNIEVYINGKYLVKDVDFTYSPLRSTDNGIALTDVIINCGSFIDPTNTGNQVEIYISSDSPTNIDAGYVVDNVLPRKNLISFWYPLISTAFIEGRPTNDLLDYAVYMVSNTNLTNGSLFELKPLIPEIVNDGLSDYSPLQDETNIEIINTYYGRTVPSYSAVVNVDTEHRLYSTYLTAIMADMVAGNLVIIDDANDATFVDQFSAYAYLKERDPTLYSDDSRVDRNFLSVAACYTQPGAMTSDQQRLIQRLITLTLITKPVVLKETLV